jgi:hypothetical protein
LNRMRDRAFFLRDQSGRLGIEEKRDLSRTLEPCTSLQVAKNRLNLFLKQKIRIFLGGHGASLSNPSNPGGKTASYPAGEHVPERKPRGELEKTTVASGKWHAEDPGVKNGSLKPAKSPLTPTQAVLPTECSPLERRTVWERYRTMPPAATIHSAATHICS